MHTKSRCGQAESSSINRQLAAGQKWTRPEQVKEFRPIYVIDSSRPGANAQTPHY